MTYSCSSTDLVPVGEDCLVVGHSQVGTNPINSLYWIFEVPTYMTFLVVIISERNYKNILIKYQLAFEYETLTLTINYPINYPY